jgi:hypothetical protein
MTTLREAAQQALQLLLDTTQIPATPDVDAAIIALRDALLTEAPPPQGYDCALFDDWGKL